MCGCWISSKLCTISRKNVGLKLVLTGINNFDKKAVRREVTMGDLVLVRQPGMSAKLSESWHRPYQIVEKRSDVNYRVAQNKKNRKVLHVNNMKRYIQREVVW